MTTIQFANIDDANEILKLQKLAYQSEAKIYNDWSLPALTQSIESIKSDFQKSIVLKLVAGQDIVGSVRAFANGETCEIGRLIVHPDFQRKGMGSELLKEIECKFSHLKRYELFTGSNSINNIKLYERHGYKVTHSKQLSNAVSITYLEKSMPSNL